MHGHSIDSDLPAVRQLIGVCPQENVLWDMLTVRADCAEWPSLAAAPCPAHDPSSSS